MVYKKQFDDHDQPHTTGSIFYTKPGVRSLGWNTVSEAVATFVLVYWIIQQAPGSRSSRPGTQPREHRSRLCGCRLRRDRDRAGLGGSTGYAINLHATWDLGSRMHFSRCEAKRRSTGVTHGYPSSDLCWAQQWPQRSTR